VNEDDDVIPHLAPLVAVPGAGPHVSCRQLHRLIFLVTEERADILTHIIGHSKFSQIREDHRDVGLTHSSKRTW
jgi:hypothetical protein